MIYLMCKSETHFLPCPFSVASLCIVLVGYKIKYSRNGIILQNSLKIALGKKKKKKEFYTFHHTRVCCDMLKSFICE